MPRICKYSDNVISMPSFEFLSGLCIFICVLFSLPTTATQSEHPSANSEGARHVTDQYHSRLSRNPGSQFLRRQSRLDSSTCPSNYDRCGNGLPDNFCCPSNSSCISLAAGTTVLCCPNGEDCSNVQASSFTCDISAYNATAFPTAVVHTTNLTGQLPTCGSNCCPYGYSCSGDTLCVRDKDDALITATSTPSTTTAATASITATGVLVSGTASTVPTKSPTVDSGASSSSTKKRTIGIATGSAVAGIAGITAVIMIAWARRRRRRRARGSTRQLPRSMSAKSPHLDSLGALQKFPNTPPPLPRKNSVRPLKSKRKSLLSWVPSVVNRTPAELPATPVSFSHWGQLERPSEVHRPYPRDSLQEDQIYELEARWLPQERHS